MDMKRIMFASVCTAGLLLFTVSQAAAQADIEIGKTTIRLQSPVKIYGQDKNVYRYDDYGTRRKKNRWYDDASVFFGFSFPVEGCSYEPTAAMPVKYGNSFEITLGAKQWFGIGHYAFGISAQYTHYDYRGSGLAAREYRYRSLQPLLHLVADADVYRPGCLGRLGLQPAVQGQILYRGSQGGGPLPGRGKVPASAGGSLCGSWNKCFRSLLQVSFYSPV